MTERHTETSPEACEALMWRHGYHKAHHAKDNDDYDYQVQLWQGGNPKRYAVTYGCQYAEGLNYAQAAAEFGQCLMHSLVCAGALDPEPETCR